MILPFDSDVADSRWAAMKVHPTAMQIGDASPRIDTGFAASSRGH
jgi:hypothetical protein